MACLYAISDIHGRYDLLQEIVDTHVCFKKGDQLILLGDYVDGGYQGNSYQALQYIYHLQQTYPQQVIALRGNHEEWLSAFLQQRTSDLNIQIDIHFETLESFMSEEEFDAIYQQACQLYQDRFLLIQNMYEKCRQLICQRHQTLVAWLEQLPYYYETSHHIFVHAGIEIIKEQPELWKEVSDVNHYLMQFPPCMGQFYKTVIAGHVGTHQIMKQPDFHRICRFGDFIYIDSSVIQTHFLNVLQIDQQTLQYHGIIKKDNQWVAYDIVNNKF
ncbi:metallophosphoesterase [Allocoprobacillus halotolerans]|uniref:Metallophosphoesterase n=1 Tax=Allocoprobacillus halotolerans TaxID=2944914 RepID=A0ABY5I304_9FIRM|nr:metallophosphoesterase [Allocoprobacillus halotolerans]UTY39157.1 metallophosphoesterase [Allocoprobacillus halotolerans]